MILIVFLFLIYVACAVLNIEDKERKHVIFSTLINLSILLVFVGATIVLYKKAIEDTKHIDILKERIEILERYETD